MPYYNNFNNGSLSYEQERGLINKSFIWMFIGLLVTAATSYIFYATGLMLYMLYYIPMSSLLLCIAQFAVVIAFTSMMNRANPSTLKVLFLVYAFTLGISLSSLCYVYTQTTLFAAFLVSALYFVCLAVIGFTTKADLSKFGVLCLAALVALLISQVIMMLFGVGMDVRLMSIIGLLIFTGLTAWDMQKLHRMSSMSIGGDMTDRLSIYFALQLYMDFINIFLYILRLLGSGNNRR